MCHVPYSVRMSMNVFFVLYIMSLAMVMCHVPYSSRLAIDVSCVILCEAGYVCISCAI